MEDRGDNIVTRRPVLGLLGSGAASLLGGCSLFSTRADYRFRMTLETGSASGSGVLQVNASKTIALTAHEHAGGAGLTGEAVAVDLPGGSVFALLTLGSGKKLLATQVTRALDPGANVVDPDAFVKAVDRLGSLPGEKAELPRADWPMMVRFRNIDDPTTVELVDPATVGVRRVVVETTSGDVTTGIEQKLRWLNRIRGGYLHGGTTSRDAPLGLTGQEFSTATR